MPLRQLRLPCLPKRRVGLAFGHFGCFSVCPLAFFPNLSDLAVVVVQNTRRVANREAKKHEQRDSNRPHGRLHLFQNLVFERHALRVVFLEPCSEWQKSPSSVGVRASWGERVPFGGHPGKLGNTTNVPIPRERFS